jgi:hypothetical protein
MSLKVSLRVIVASSISPYGAALIGAIGAIIGGLLTSGTTLLVEWRRDRPDQPNALPEMRLARSVET